MIMSATLSVILPNYNHAKLIGRALRMMLAQERAADEIVVIDDASTDDSIEVIEQFAAAAPSIRLLRNSSNKGVVPTLQRGLEAASGQYVYFAAADDWVLPGFFELSLRRLGECPDVGLFCGEAVLVDARTDRPFSLRPAVRPRMRAGCIEADRVAHLLRSTDNWILTGSSIFRRECVLWAGSFDARLGSFADGIMARKIALKFGFFFEPTAVATWAVSQDSFSRRTALELSHAKHVLDVVPAMLSADPGFPAWYADKFRDRWRFATCRLALVANPVDRALVLEMGARGASERAALDKLFSLPGRNLSRLAVLVRLWQRLRPTSLTALLRTMLSMRHLRLSIGFRFREFYSKRAAGGSGAP
jgi:glycosyltransferase involved in cell wall biosynthesis